MIIFVRTWAVSKRPVPVSQRSSTGIRILASSFL